MFLHVIRRVNPKITTSALSLGAKSDSSLHQSPNFQPCRTIINKQFLDKSNKPAPWPYKEKKYTFMHAMFQNTTPRFDENTRLIIVEGNIGAGKSTVAKKLAEELGMQHMPEVTTDKLYIDDFGFDYRSVDHLLPESLKYCDAKRFYSDPHHRNVGMFQMMMYGLRLEQYMNALAHLFNTGDGVVLERCAYSDFVFMEAMHKMEYISDGVKRAYNEIKEATITELIKPHLVIYLDVPVETIQQRIKLRNNPIEINSKVLTKEYLQTIDHHYKQVYLKDIGKYSELLVYDWSNFGDPEAIVEDVVRIDFDRYDVYDTKLKEWRSDDRWYWNNLRRRYTNDKLKILGMMNNPCYEVKELFIPQEDVDDAYERVFDHVPSYQYEKGSNPLTGDKGYLFKTKRNYWDDQRYKTIDY